eukprot:581252-Pelagomonas_calceolata.AAC.5
MQATRITCRSCSQLRPPSDRELRTHTAAMGIDLSLLTRSARRGGMVPADARAVRRDSFVCKCTCAQFRHEMICFKWSMR